ncbi:TspO/MBR family protein [Nocardiopsis valliformis]|uniref:TspO/MBR family protein n=1 Tax=Nocardiopsis valliformis TaxID=239974 RepID=UPI00034D48D5|nr:TspO/MBR family protein [Nocardiopsis valliformis]
MESSVRTTPEPGHSLMAAAAFAVAVLATALVGGSAAAGSGDVYARLDLPAWAPPSWLFSPVWIVLYVLIGVAGWLVWRAAGTQGAMVFLAVYTLQLLLNAAWTPLFFGAGLYGLAFVDIVLLAVAVAVTLLLAWRHSRTAALLLAPYLAWVCFAAALNAAIWAAN